MPKVVDHDQRRAEILGAARTLIAKKGVAAATMREVSTAAGCTTGALTHYFPDRHAILVGAIRSAHAAAGDRMRARAGSEKTPVARLRAIVLEALPLDAVRKEEWRIWLAFWGEALGDSRLRRENARRYREWSSLLDELLVPLLPARAARADALTALQSLVDGLGLRLILHDERAKEPLSAARTTVARLVKAHLERFATSPRGQRTPNPHRR